MRAIYCLEILAITALFVNYVAGDAKAQTTTETSIDNTTSVSEEQTKSSTDKNPDSPSKNATKKPEVVNWMRRMGHIENDLINVQAIIVKDERLNNKCGPAPKKASKRYLMCGGSMLTVNYVLTSASCVHEATHIRHNVHAPLAVIVAPFKKSMQLIPVIHYVIHPKHRTNPYSPGHVKHNIAILKLSCRIDIENLQKIELPTLPMKKTCSDETCLVPIYRRTGMVNHVMFQIIAPNILNYPRRGRETSVGDVELYRNEKYGRLQMIDGSIRLGRPKRKLAGPPSFLGGYESRIIFDDDSTNSTTEGPTENSNVEETMTVAFQEENLSSTAQTSLHEEVSKALSKADGVLKPVKSIVVRASEFYIPCAHTGAPVMHKRTQAALVAIPCNGRQRYSSWHYVDLFDNLDWIRKVTGELPDDDGRPPGVGSQPQQPGNSSGCSTCIFNFFIEIGCKEKGNCGKNATTSVPYDHSHFRHNDRAELHPLHTTSANASLPVPPNPSLPGFTNPFLSAPPNPFLPRPPNSSLPGADNISDDIRNNPLGEVPSNSPGEVPPNSPSEITPNPPVEIPANSPYEVPPGNGPPMKSARRKMQGSCTGNSASIFVGPGCEKTEKESNIIPSIYRTKSVKTMSGVGKTKHLSQNNNAVGNVPQLQQPVTVRTFKTLFRDYYRDKAKYPVKDNHNNRISTISESLKIPVNRNLHRERATNDIGLKIFEGDNTD